MSKSQFLAGMILHSIHLDNVELIFLFPSIYEFTMSGEKARPHHDDMPNASPYKPEKIFEPLLVNGPCSGPSLFTVMLAVFEDVAVCMQNELHTEER